MPDEPRVFLTLTLDYDGVSGVLQRTWEREGPAWWRPRIGDGLDVVDESANTYRVKDVIWTADGLVVELEYTIGQGAPQSRWDEARESLRRDGFAPVKEAG